MPLTPPKQHSGTFFHNNQSIMYNIFCSKCKQHLYSNCRPKSKNNKIGHMICTECISNGRGQRFSKSYYKLVTQSSYYRLQDQKDRLTKKLKRSRQQTDKALAQLQIMKQREQNKWRNFIFNSFQEELAIQAVINCASNTKTFHFYNYINNIKEKANYLTKNAEKIIQNTQKRVQSALNEIFTTQINQFVYGEATLDFRDTFMKLLKIERYVEKVQEQMRELKIKKARIIEEHTPRDEGKKLQWKDEVVFGEEKVAGLKKYFQVDIDQYKAKIKTLQALVKDGQKTIISIKQNAEFKVVQSSKQLAEQKQEWYDLQEEQEKQEEQGLDLDESQDDYETPDDASYESQQAK